MLPKVSLFHGLLDANPKMRKRVWTAPARADRSSGIPGNQQKTTKTRHVNKHPHTPSIFMKKLPNGSPKKYSFRVQNGFFFSDFDLGAPGVPKEATKLPKDGQGTPNGRPKVHKGLKRVWKWSPKVAKSLTISSKRFCDDTSLGHKHSYNTKTHKTRS